LLQKTKTLNQNPSMLLVIFACSVLVVALAPQQKELLQN